MACFIGAQTIRVRLSVYGIFLQGGAPMTLAEENEIARSMGLTYGQYKMQLFMKQREGITPPSHPEKTRKSKRRYTDEEAFALWQAGKNDCEIGAIFGVSRQSIQKWRDTMELPSTAKNDIDTQKYRLVKTNAGMYVINDDEEE